LNSGSQ